MQTCGSHSTRQQSRQDERAAAPGQEAKDRDAGSGPRDGVHLRTEQRETEQRGRRRAPEWVPVGEPSPGGAVGRFDVPFGIVQDDAVAPLLLGPVQRLVGVAQQGALASLRMLRREGHAPVYLFYGSECCGWIVLFVATLSVL